MKRCSDPIRPDWQAIASRTSSHVSSLCKDVEAAAEFVKLLCWKIDQRTTNDEGVSPNDMGSAFCTLQPNPWAKNVDNTLHHNPFL